jgi:predicted PurR-regulated permease PerM
MTTEPIAVEAAERRRVERRRNQLISELTIPEFRRIVVTSLFFLLVLSLFLWMVRSVLIAGILAVIVATYLRPLYRRLLAWVKRPTAAAILAITVAVVPVLAALVYSYIELQEAATYVSSHEAEIAERIDSAIRRIPFVEGRSFSEQIRNSVAAASHYGSSLVRTLKDTVIELGISAAVFLFTTGYIFTDAERIAAYVRSKVPPRYGALSEALERNVRGVLYGALYATLLTQSIKSLVILAMNLAFHVPLAVVLALLSFVIGLFPIVGSWSVYVPVAIWLIIFRDAWVPALTMLAIGFFGNTLFISMYVRPKVAAEKSGVLNFYWMFVGLVTGVYTFGLVGVLLGPIVIGLLKAVLDTITEHASWRLLGFPADDEQGEIVSQT